MHPNLEKAKAAVGGDGSISDLVSAIIRGAEARTIARSAGMPDGLDPEIADDLGVLFRVLAGQCAAQICAEHDPPIAYLDFAIAPPDADGKFTDGPGKLAYLAACAVGCPTVCKCVNEELGTVTIYPDQTG